jgi:hypothetical protein
MGTAPCAHSGSEATAPLSQNFPQHLNLTKKMFFMRFIIYFVNLIINLVNDFRELKIL